VFARISEPYQNSNNVAQPDPEQDVAGPQKDVSHGLRGEERVGVGEGTHAACAASRLGSHLLAAAQSAA
jgi:hypothetical protein